MGTGQENHTNQRALVLTLSAVIPVTVFCAFALLKIPADQKNAFLFGLSKERLLMFGGFVFLLSADIFALINHKKLTGILFKNGKYKTISTVITVLSLFFLLMPEYRFHAAAAYFDRLKPYILWLFLSSGLFTVLFFYAKDRFLTLRKLEENLAAQRSCIFPVLFIILAGIIFVELSGLGKTVEDSLWNKNGIPLQSIQLFCSILIFALSWKCGLFSFLSKNKIIVHFFVIWAISAAVWSLAAQRPHFFAPGPYLPDQQYYPYSDAVTYDIAAQTAINGWGFNLKRTVLKPALVFIDFLSHLISGNNYNISMLVQSALFAMLPAVIFLFGNAIGEISCGYLAAVFSILKEWNALNTQEVLTIHSRLAMSEFLMQIILASFCYTIFRWLKQDGKEIRYASIAGGTLMLGVFTRYNFMAFLPAALVILIAAYRKQFQSFLKPLLFFFLTMFLTAAPMLIRDAVTSSGMISELSYTVQNVLIRQRFQEKSPFQDSSEQHSQIALNTEKDTDFPENKTDEFNTRQITQEFTNNNSNKKLSLIPSMINHSLHNIISSVLTLPMKIRFDDLPHLYTQEGDGLWRDNWQGQFSFPQWIILGIWSVLGSIAIGILIKNHGMAGFSILYFWFVYAFSIGFSRSSGGRYIVPMNWIPMLLLAFILTVLLSNGTLKLPEYTESFVSIRKTIPVIAAFPLFFTVMLLFENFMPSKNTSAPDGDLAVLKKELADHEEINWDQVENQQAEGILHINHGIAIYPRFYYYLVGEHSSSGSTMWKDYSRMTFMGINKDAEDILYQEYLMPHTEAVNTFPQDSVFRAISCTSEFGYEDVLAVTIETPTGEIYTYIRDPLPEFACPVPEPVCLSLENCF